MTHDDYIEFYGDDHDDDSYAVDIVREDVQSDAEWLGVTLPAAVAAEVENELLNIGVVDDVWDPEFRQYEVEPADIILRRFPVLVGLARKGQRLTPPRGRPARRPAARTPRARRVAVRRRVSTRAGPDDPSRLPERLTRPGDSGAGFRMPALERGPSSRGPPGRCARRRASRFPTKTEVSEMSTGGVTTEPVQERVYRACLERLEQRWLTVDQVHEIFYGRDLDTNRRFFCARAQKSLRGRPLASKTVEIREAILNLQDKYTQMTVRQIFYQLSVAKIVPKSEGGGYRPVQAQVLKLRRENFLPWSFVGDGTRWANAPETWDRSEDAIREMARTYRRNRWRSQKVRIEVWLEKDALASVIQEVTYKWGVRLMVSRGQSSDTYCYEAAREAKEAWEKAGVSTVVYALYDSDKSGRSASQKIEEKLRQYSDGAPIEYELLAVTDRQIREWDLPTRPPKEKRGKGAADDEKGVVELDAIPPERLLDLVDGAILAWVDEDAWEMERVYEEEERRGLALLTLDGEIGGAS